MGTICFVTVCVAHLDTSIAVSPVLSHVASRVCERLPRLYFDLQFSNMKERRAYLKARRTSIYLPYSNLNTYLLALCFLTFIAFTHQYVSYSIRAQIVCDNCLCISCMTVTCTVVCNKNYTKNVVFFICLFLIFFKLTSIMLICHLLVLLNNVHLNPGPDTQSLLSNSSSYNTLDILNKGLSIMHLNIQSLRSKLDIIEAEIQSYDIVVLSETWLSNDIED